MNHLRYYILVFLVVLCPESLLSQSHLSEQVSATNLGLSQTAGSLRSVWSTLLNPASLSALTLPLAGITYHILVPGTGLSQKTASLTVPFFNKAIGLGYIQQGDQSFHEDYIAINYSQLLSEYFSFGMRFGYQLYQFSEEGTSKGLYSFSSGICYRKRSFTFGIYANNIFSGKFSSLVFTTKPIPYIVVNGYLQLSENCLLLSRISFYDESTIPLAFAVQYSFNNRLFVRTGVRGNPMKPSGGLGYLWQNLECNFAVDYHQVLGVSSSVSFSYRFVHPPKSKL